MRPPVQRATASSSDLSTADPHSGHFVGIVNQSRFSRGPGLATRATSGITSPARAHDDGVAPPDVLAADLVLVVQRAR
jgi:hypothetical protein